MLCATLAATALAADHGTCGYQCTTDADCSGCGTAGKCSQPKVGGSNATFQRIASACTSAPTPAPADPAASVADSVWPSQWTADVESWTYGDWSDTSAVAKGKFFYDGVGGHSRGEWHPYINGKDATQVWIGGTGSAKSNYYVKNGALCIYFPITDPAPGGSVSIERPDWVKNCDAAGFAKYEGREQVSGEWADHYSCILDYAAANQTIAFQNWHSLGLGATPKGLPMRVTGGNSAPDAQQGSPRLNTVWYTNFTTGSGSVTPDEFVKPKGMCIPVGREEAAAFLGVKRVTHQLLSSPAMQKRAHYLPHAAPTAADLLRAATAKPRAAFAAATLRGAMGSLNRHLAAEPGLATRECSALDLADVHAAQRELFAARSPALQHTYEAKSDNRRLPYASDADLLAAQSERDAAARAQPALRAMVRDGVCHEVVMQYVHHLSASARAEVKSGALTLPLLPERDMHPAPAAGGAAAAKAHSAYTAQVSCAICHVTA